MWHYGPWSVDGGSHWWWMMPFHGLFSLLFFVLVAWAVVALVRHLTARKGGSRSPGLDALDERYAKGEIQREEYLQKRRDLGA